MKPIRELFKMKQVRVPQVEFDAEYTIACDHPQCESGRARVRLLKIERQHELMHCVNLTVSSYDRKLGAILHLREYTVTAKDGSRSTTRIDTLVFPGQQGYDNLAKRCEAD